LLEIEAEGYSWACICDILDVKYFKICYNVGHKDDGHERLAVLGAILSSFEFAKNNRG